MPVTFDGSSSASRAQSGALLPWKPLALRVMPVVIVYSTMPLLNGKRPKEGVQWLLRAGMLCQPAVICTYVIPERDMQHKFDQSIRTSTSCKLRAYFPLVCKAAC